MRKYYSNKLQFKLFLQKNNKYIDFSFGSQVLK